EKCPSANPPTTGSAQHRSARETAKADISTLQENGHFYLALTALKLKKVIVYNKFFEKYF
ncbi:MAG: hypothetical protein B7Z65_09330, partial [Ferrovum sp. 21-44-67]